MPLNTFLTEDPFLTPAFSNSLRDIYSISYAGVPIGGGCREANGLHNHTMKALLFFFYMQRTRLQSQDCGCHVDIFFYPLSADTPVLGQVFTRALMLKQELAVELNICL